MVYLVSYDIADNRRRAKIAKTLKDFGDRVQLSLFECSLEKDLYERMVVRLEKVVTEEDSLRIYALCGKCDKPIESMGAQKVIEDPEVYIL